MYIHICNTILFAVRGPNDEDLSTFVQEVVFTLHPSFPNPVKTVTSPPFEVTEVGWGEFEAGIRIVFKSVNKEPKSAELNVRNSGSTGEEELGGFAAASTGTASAIANAATTSSNTPVSATVVMRSASNAILPLNASNVESSALPTPTMNEDGILAPNPDAGNSVNMTHVIRLYHPLDDVTSANLKRPVVAEVYDEIVIPNPTPHLLYNCQRYGDSSHASLQQQDPTVKPYTVTPDLYKPFASEMASLEQLTTVYSFIKEELESKWVVCSH